MTKTNTASSLDKRILEARNWRTLYVSPRMNQIQDVLFFCGIREPKLSQLVLAIDRLAVGKADQPLWVDGGRFWVLFTQRGFRQINKSGRRRPTLRQVEQRYGL